jgi:hypothetical protein
VNVRISVTIFDIPKMVNIGGHRIQGSPRILLWLNPLTIQGCALNENPKYVFSFSLSVPTASHIFCGSVHPASVAVSGRAKVFPRLGEIHPQ